MSKSRNSPPSTQAPPPAPKAEQIVEMHAAQSSAGRSGVQGPLEFDHGARAAGRQRRKGTKSTLTTARMAPLAPIAATITTSQLVAAKPLCHSRPGLRRVASRGPRLIAPIASINSTDTAGLVAGARPVADPLDRERSLGITSVTGMNCTLLKGTHLHTGNRLAKFVKARMFVVCSDI